MTRMTNVRFFITRLLAMLVLALSTGLIVNGQEPEYGALPVWSSGDFEAQIRIEIFNDYQCPPCAVMNEQIMKAEAKYPRKVRFTFRNFPLSMHPNALAAAKAADAAGFQDKFRHMINLLYRHQEEWSKESDPTPLFESYGRRIGLDMERFTTDMTSEKIAERIDLDIKRGKFLGVKGTPALFRFGREIPASDVTDLVEFIGKTF